MEESKLDQESLDYYYNLTLEYKKCEELVESLSKEQQKELLKKIRTKNNESVNNSNVKK
jgi:predicted transcriptional regulator